MPATVVTVLEEAKSAYLNFGGVTDTSLLPILNSEYRNLQRILRNANAPIMKEQWGPIAITGVSGVSIDPLTSTPTMTNLISPFLLEERAVGGVNSDYVPMIERFPLPVKQQEATLIYWAWREELIYLIGASANREVRVSGTKSFPAITTTIGTTLAINDIETYLAASVAAKAALTIGRNPTLAAEIREKYVEMYLRDVLNQYAQKEQTLPFRHRTWRRGG